MAFYGMGWQEVERMPLSRFIKLFRCASMLDARETFRDIKVASYPYMKEQDQNRLHTQVKSATTAFMASKMTDFKTVVGNLARKMMKNG